MGKINKKNIKLKAKSAIKKVASKLQNSTSNAPPSIKSKTDEKDKLLLNATSVPKKTISKREKYRTKHKNLMNKFALIKKQRKEEIARKNREKAAVIGDLNPLKDALPSLDELYKWSKENAALKTGVKEFDEAPAKLSVKQKFRMKKNKFIDQCNSYQAMMNNPDFKKNPRALISQQIQQKHGLLDE